MRDERVSSHFAMAVALLILNRGGDDVLVTTVLWLVSANRDGWRRVLIGESAIALWKRQGCQ